MHFANYCHDKKFTNEEFEAKVQDCEKELATKVCDKGQADLLWCMGRVTPETYLHRPEDHWRTPYASRKVITNNE